MLHPGDKKAAFVGLIIGAVALLSIMLTIVKFTNQHYARTSHAEAPR